jgi:putative transposase
MKGHQADHPIATMGRVLGVSPSGYYAWQQRAPSARAQHDATLTMKIHTIHLESRGTYGAPRVHAELAAQGVVVGRKRVARLMRRAQLRGVTRRKWITTTTRAPDATPTPDLVHRQFTATGRDQLWVADITYVPTGAGYLYLAVVLDVWSRRVVGWAMETHLRTELVLAALDMAVQQRRPRAVIHHSDHGCQYTSIAFGQRCDAAGVRPSMGSVGDAYDNALCESFFATLECELLDRTRFATPPVARAAVFDFIEGWYNPRRRHSALRYESPIGFERLHAVPTVIPWVPPKRTSAVEPREGPLDEGGAISLSPQTGLFAPSTRRGSG